MTARNEWRAPDVQPADLDEVLSRRVSERDGKAYAKRLDSGASSICSVCGCTAVDDDVDDTNGWRWYSDGRGGLHPLCATCPVPTSLSVQNA
jgi:hypothetical protein